MIDRSLFNDVLHRLGVDEVCSGVSTGAAGRGAEGAALVSINPSTGEPLGTVTTASVQDYDRVLEASVQAFQTWRSTPPPTRGEIVRQIGLELRANKADLGLLVTLEVGKTRSEGEGEVQEMIDMCDFAVGLSRQLYGLTMASERPEHRMFEQWHPLGPMGLITPFNFPVAIWAWNAAVAAVCGDPVVWKPSPLAPLTAVAVQRIVDRVAAASRLEGVFNLCIGRDAELGRMMAHDRRLPLISATGSYEMGRSVGQTVAARLGRSLLELGGNNAAIVSEAANLDLALRAVVFAAAGTAGQRCTTLRRLFVHKSVADGFVDRLRQAYESIRIGDPWEAGVLVGPLIDERAVNRMLSAVEKSRDQGGELVFGGKRLDRAGFFVEPTIIRATPDMSIVSQETFAPILYVMTYSSLEEAIDGQNSVSPGLSSAIFTDRVTEAERFLSPEGSDCGIANVNTGTSGAEIGGAFGGEKDTGGGREAGSDAWKAYMRRQTCSVNYGDDLPLAQGVEFAV